MNLDRCIRGAGIDMKTSGPTTVRKCLLQVAASALLLAFAGCNPSSAPDGTDPESAERSVLRRGNGGEPQTLDPALAEDVHAFNVLTDLYEGLLATAADGSLIPGAAESWKLSADGLRYSFRIRENAIWSNGEPVTADHFVAGIRRAVRPGSLSSYSFLFEPIANYAVVIDGTAPLAELGVSAPDRRTLLIELGAPAHHFLNVLAMPVAFPSYADGDADSLRYRDASHFVGNGPYVLDEWSIGEKIRLQKNLRYRRADDIQVEQVEYYPIVDTNTELNMYRAGELDITATVPPAAIGQLRDSNPDELRIVPSLALYYLAFDLSEAPFDNQLLRQALTMTIDRQALVSVLGRGEQEAFGLVPPGVANYSPAEYAWKEMSGEDRKDKGREIFAQAGYETDRPLRIRLTYDVGDVHEKVALAVSSMWRDALGIEVELDKKEWKHFLATREDHSAWQVMRFAWTGDYNDASTFTDIFRSDSPQNLPGYRSAEYDQLLDDAGNSNDENTRAALMAAAEEHFINEYPIAPLYFFVSKHLVKPRVGNFQDNVLDRHPSQYIHLLDD